MKRSVILTLMASTIMCCLSLSSLAQSGGVSGKITDKNTGEPLAFATILALQADTATSGTLTDIEGHYLVKLKPGTYLLQVSYVGYEEATVEISISGNEFDLHDIALSLISIDLDMVEIEAYMPSISVDASMSVEYTVVAHDYVSSEKTALGFSRAGGYESVEVVSRSGSGSFSSGVLTAGEIKDLGKWELWKDIASSDLQEWQKAWSFAPLAHYTVLVENNAGKPLPDAIVRLISSNGTIIWVARTDNTGKAELWQNIFKDGKDKKNCSIEVEYNGKVIIPEKAFLFGEGINILQIPEACNPPEIVDIMFVVDATSSMGDEIEYLKEEMTNIIEKVKKAYPNKIIRLGCEVYRDEGDEYVTRSFDFTYDPEEAVSFIRNQYGAGGGDMPESVDKALDVAVNNMSWSENAVARLLFLILDAPPHNVPSAISSVQKSAEEAAAKGIRIIPITGSGIDKSTEYLMRCLALSTNGTYIFLTDHSGVGGAHITPSTDEYDVMLLNELLLSVIDRYLYSMPCDSQINIYEIRDTVKVVNPAIVAHEIADSALVGKYVASTHDTNILAITPEIDSIPVAHDSTEQEIPIENDIKINGFIIYPNPTNGPLTVEIDGKTEEMFLADINGKLLERIVVKGNTVRIDLGKYPSGVYYLQCIDNGRLLSGKVVLIR